MTWSQGSFNAVEDSNRAGRFDREFRFQGLRADIFNDLEMLKNEAKTVIFQRFKKRRPKNIGQFLNLSQNLLDTSGGTP